MREEVTSIVTGAKEKKSKQVGRIGVGKNHYH